jgi:hypothetical protein
VAAGFSCGGAQPAITAAAPATALRIMKARRSMPEGMSAAIGEKASLSS